MIFMAFFAMVVILPGVTDAKCNIPKCNMPKICEKLESIDTKLGLDLQIKCTLPEVCEQLDSIDEKLGQYAPVPKTGQTSCF